jgi:hypothetical protein
MKTLILAMLVSGSLLGEAWCQAFQPRTATDLARYLGPYRERLLYEGAKKEGKLVWYTSLTIIRNWRSSSKPNIPASPLRSIAHRP